MLIQNYIDLMISIFRSCTRQFERWRELKFVIKWYFLAGFYICYKEIRWKSLAYRCNFKQKIFILLSRRIFEFVSEISVFSSYYICKYVKIRMTSGNCNRIPNKKHPLWTIRHPRTAYNLDNAILASLSSDTNLFHRRKPGITFKIFYPADDYYPKVAVLLDRMQLSA